MKRKILSLLLLSFIIIKAYPQSFISKEIRGERGISKQFISLDDEQLVSFNGTQTKSLLGLNQNSELVLRKTEQDKLGFIHYRYFQTYRSIPIENTMYIIHTKNGVLKSLGGAIVIDFDKGMDQRGSSTIRAEQAVSIAIKTVGAKVYAWQEPGMEKVLKVQTKDANATYRPTGNLVWYSSTDVINPRSLRLCYKVDVFAAQPLSRAYYYIDARTGKVLGKQDRLQPTDAVGTAATAYSGSQTIHSDLNAGSYRLWDLTKGGGVITQHGETGSIGVDYSSASPNWTLGGNNIAALDAHYGISQTYAFYFSNFGRNSYDNLGSALISFVNYSGIDNAYWNGTYMLFCPRSGNNPGGTTGIDVAGHEVTHGVTQETSGLVYEKEPGAINESMSDIMGKAVQFWSKPADIDWRLSNDMGWIIRDMSNPNAQGQPDTYLGSLWGNTVGCVPDGNTNDNCWVHYNSGVGNFMFYLLVTGGTGTNDNGHAYSVSGIGLDHAAQILYRTNAFYLSPNSQYADWRTACITAATDLYGAGSNDLAQVQNAWHAVGVGAAAGGCAQPTGLSASSITSTSATVSWGAATGALKYKLQYRIGTPGIPFTTVNNIVGTSYNLTGLVPNTTYKYKVQSLCAGTTKSVFSTVQSFKTKTANDYCSILGSTGFEYIDRVKFGIAIDNTSGNNNGYGDYTALIKSAGVGTTQKLTLTPGFYAGDPSAPYDEYWEVYCDYNQDRDFTDAGEKVGQGHGLAAIIINFTVPLTAKNGATRMRIVMHFGNYLGQSCDAFADGEAEDYTVKILNGTLNVAAGNDLKQQNTLNINSLAVLPNPVKTSSANLVLQAGKAGPVNIRVSDLSGRILRSETISSVSVGKNNYALRNLNLLPGIYVIIATQGNAVIARTQFIVDK